MNFGRAARGIGKFLVKKANLAGRASCGLEKMQDNHRPGNEKLDKKAGKRRCLPAVLCAILLLLTASAKGQFVTNGSASSAGNGCWQLTPDEGGQAGSIFSASPISLNAPFFYSTRLSFGCKDLDGADGIVFIFATTNTALGGPGGGIGYQGITPSIAIEWDDYQNGNFGDPAADHMAIMRNGSVDHNSADNLVGPIPLPNIEDCNEHCVTISWDPSTMTLSASIDGNSISYTGDIVNDIFGGNPNVFWGFSSGTGALSNLHTVCSGPPQVQPMPDVEICPGESVQLQADPNGTSWFWAPHPSLSAYNISNPIATPTNTTLYSVTITYACGATATDNVLVTILPPPPATASSNSPVCVGESLELMAGGGTSYQWAGPQGFGASSQNPTIPNVQFDQAGLYSVTVTGANGCTSVASTVVTVLPPAAVAIIPPPQPVCALADPFTLQGIPAGGTWGGAANSAGVVDPGALGPGFHLVTYTATDANGCEGTAELVIEIIGPPAVTISQAGPWCESDGVQLLDASPTGGQWGGVADPLGRIDPASLGAGTWQATYTAGPTGCQASDTLTFDVLPTASVHIVEAGPWCADADPDTLQASPTGGTWSGAANSLGVIEPDVLGPGVHTVYYTWSDSAHCEATDTLEITIHQLPEANLYGGDTLCPGGADTAFLELIFSGVPPFEIAWRKDDQPLPNLTILQDSVLVPVIYGGTYTLEAVVDATGCTQAASGSATIVEAPTLLVTGPSYLCDSTLTTYQVLVEIHSADTNTLVVSGLSGTLEPGEPARFTSDPIPSGQSFSLAIFDGFGCDTILLDATYSCACLSEAGDMASDLVQTCMGDTLEVSHLGGEVLDGNDVLSFVLHDLYGNSLGNVFAIHSDGRFWLVPPMQPGVTYYVSAVAGNDDGNGLVDLADPCLDVSIGQPVRFNALPGGSIDAPAEICEGQSLELTFSLYGTGPFTVSWTDGQDTSTFQTLASTHAISATPSESTTYTLVEVTDGHQPACNALLLDSTSVTVWPVVHTSVLAFMCPGESYFAGGAWQTEAGLFYDTLATGHGCDSVVITDLKLWPTDTTLLFDDTCDPSAAGTFTSVLTNQWGCDSVVITTVSLLPSDTVYLQDATCDPAAAGTFTAVFTNQWGCDSTVITTVSLLPSDTVYLEDSTCDPDATGIFTSVLTNQWGCDSTIVLTVSYAETDTTWLDQTTCDPQQTGVFIQNLEAADGCDSVVVTMVSLLPSDTVYVQDATCDPSSVGTFTSVFTNQWGCDSVVVTTVSLLPSDTVYVQDATCDPSSVGTFTSVFTNQWGCDSVVVTTVSLLPSDTVYVQDATCDPSSVGTFTSVFTNQWGCDSVVVTTVSLLPSDTVYLQDATCDPSSVGTFTSVFTNQWGCDSVVVTTVSLLPSDTTLTASFTCHPTDTGTFVQHFTNQWGCDSTVLQVVSLWPLPSVEILPQLYNGYAVPCAEGGGGVAEAIVQGGTSPFAFQWSDGQQGSKATDLMVGPLSVTVTDANGCQAEATTTLTSPDSLQLDITISNPACFGQSQGTIVVDAIGGVPPYRYALNGGPFGNKPLFSGLGAGIYQVSVLDANDCPAADIVLIQTPWPLEVDLGEDFVIQLGEDTVLHARVNVPYDSLAKVIWQGIDSTECPHCLDQPVAPLFTTAYSITVTDERGCQASDGITVRVDRRKHVYVPNAFSPNGDGINDLFLIYAKEGTVRKVRSFRVFSRWGETVFEQYDFQPNDPVHGWDGTHRNQALDPAVFAWFAVIEFIDGSTELFEGDVVLMRK
ncbi:MAG: hypothetical protein KatS3mg029_0678 [Saprospiraceae bacterium]|nr:MAG: hypothetical protein KatS3mg029_0678 [Saprospiraceae bacterium]